MIILHSSVIDTHDCIDIHRVYNTCIGVTQEGVARTEKVFTRKRSHTEDPISTTEVYTYNDFQDWNFSLSYVCTYVFSLHAVALKVWTGEFGTQLQTAGGADRATEEPQNNVQAYQQKSKDKLFDCQ